MRDDQPDELDEATARVERARVSGISGLADAEHIVMLFERALLQLRDPSLDPIERAKLTRKLHAARNAFRGVAADFTGPTAFDVLFRILVDCAHYLAWLGSPSHERWIDNGGARDDTPFPVIVVANAQRRLAEYTSVRVDDRILLLAIERWREGGVRRNEAVLEVIEALGMATRSLSPSSVGEKISRFTSSQSKLP